MTRCLLLLACLLPAVVQADEPPRWMRSVAVIAVDQPAGESGEEWVARALDEAAALQACADQVPEGPVGSEERLVTLEVGLWEDGRVRDLVSAGGDDLPAALLQCVDGVARAMRFPVAKDRSDERSIGVTVRIRWQRARLDLLAVSDDVRRAVLDVPEPTIEGHFDINMLLAELERLSRPIARCVSRRRAKVADMGTRMDVKVRLSRDPETYAAQVDSMVVVDSDLGDEDAEVCVMKQLQRVDWPPPHGMSTGVIIWPFVFAR